MEERNEKEPKKQPLTRGVHFYIEDGKYLFTEKYLRERGYCCESGCRHCPYGFQKLPSTDH